jgi:hypothetical protein
MAFKSALDTYTFPAIVSETKDPGGFIYAGKVGGMLLVIRCRLSVMFLPVTSSKA